MKSLVTGGAGFIGSNLVDKLISIGHEVVCIDNEASNNDVFYWNSKSINVKANICNYEGIRHFFKNVDYVFHMAAESRIQNTIDNPSKAINVNSYGTAVVLQCAKENNVKRLVFSSTSSVYGKNDSPNNENQTPDCLNPYSASKLHGEHLCKIYNDLFELETIILRYFNVYGNREPIKGMYAPVIGIFKRQRDAKEHLTVTGDGLQKRDFINVFDVVEANVLAATKKIPNEFLGTAFNIGSGRNNTILEIAKIISNKLDYPWKEPKFISARSGEMKETLANISKANSILEWKPNIELVEYLKSI